MKTVSKISTGQFFSLLLLSRLLTTLTFMPMFSMPARTSDYIIAMVFGSVLIPLSCVPVLLLYRKQRDKNIVDLSYDISPIFSKIIAVVYVFLFMFYAFTTLARLNLFVETVVFPDIETTFFVIVSVLAACYAAHLGLEPLGRAGAVSLFLFCGSFLIILLTMISKIDINNLSPVFYDGAKPVINNAFAVLIRTIEPAIFAVLIPRVSGNIKKGFIIWAIAFSVTVTLIFFFLMSGLGETALLQMFPVHSMAVLSEFSVFERLDVLLTGVWIISAFIKISFMVYLSAETLSKSFEKKHSNVYIIIAGLLLIAAVAFESTSYSTFRITTSITIRAVLFFLFVIVLPLVVLVCGKIHKKVKSE